MYNLTANRADYIGALYALLALRSQLGCLLRALRARRIDLEVRSAAHSPVGRLAMIVDRVVLNCGDTCNVSFCSL